jgi:hypothetical protein
LSFIKLILDIQGVNNFNSNHYFFTDPAILIEDASEPLLGYASDANTGQLGIVRFFETHECNHICQYFNLAKHPQQRLADDTEQTPITPI